RDRPPDGLAGHAGRGLLPALRRGGRDRLVQGDPGTLAHLRFPWRSQERLARLSRISALAVASPAPGRDEIAGERRAGGALISSPELVPNRLSWGMAFIGK